MPSHYWYTCDRCGESTYRYRNVRRCGCGGNLIRRGYVIPGTFRHAGITLQKMPPHTINEPMLDLLSQLDDEHLSYMAAIISAWIAVRYDADKFRGLMRRIEAVKKEAQP